MRKQNTLLTLLAISAVVLSAQTENANPDSVAELDKMVITATKTARKTSEIPVSVTVISLDEIKASSARSIDDLLQYAAGVQVKRAVGMGEGVPSDIIMRGIPGALAATRTLILVDGIPTNASGTPFLIINEIPLEAVKRVEIVRGPFSSLYGANAFGGVINIITQTGDGKPRVQMSAETSLPFTSAHNYMRDDRSYGRQFWNDAFSEAYWNGTGLLSGGNERFDILLSGGYRSIGNYYMRDSALAKGKNIEYLKSRENYDYRDYRLFLKSGLRISEQLSTNLQARYFNSDLGFSKTKNTQPPVDVVTKGDKFLIGPSMDYAPADWLKLHIGGFYRMVNGEYFNEAPSEDGFVPSLWNGKSDDWQIEGQGILKPFKTHTFIIGFDHLWNNIEFGAMRNRNTSEIIPPFLRREKLIRNFGLYLQDEISVFRGIKVVPALRYDLHSLFGGEFSPKLGISGPAGDLFFLRMSGGGAFRAPSTTELYMPDFPVSVFRLVSNSSLKPEYVWAFDCGADFKPLKNLTITSDFFSNYMKDMITFNFIVGEDLFNTTVTHGNVESARSWGVENQLQWDPFAFLSLKGNYTFTESENEKYKVSLDYIARHKFNVEVNYKKSFGDRLLEAGIAEGFVGKREYFDWGVRPDVIIHEDLMMSDSLEVKPFRQKLDPYFKTDLSVSYSFNAGNRISLIIQNLFNAEGEESGGTFVPGRFMGLKYTCSLGLK
ncbi:MAG: TonB-dependent receptor [Fibrobacter sp.]|nr:TonB-dependent receptor [Fibrobacter sp.]